MNGCKRILSIILMSVILTGCSQRSSEIMLIENEPSEEQEHMFLSVFGYKADALNLIAIEKILNRFMEENPDIIVNYEGVKGIEYWKAFERRAEANVLDDVFMVDHDRVINMADKGKLADLSSLSTIENYQDRRTVPFTSCPHVYRSTDYTSITACWKHMVRKCRKTGRILWKSVTILRQKALRLS